MPKIIKQSELCKVCRFDPICSKTECRAYQSLEDCRCEELKERIENAIMFAEDAGVQEVIDALDGKIKYQT